MNNKSYWSEENTKRIVIIERKAKRRKAKKMPLKSVIASVK